MSTKIDPKAVEKAGGLFAQGFAALFTSLFGTESTEAAPPASPTAGASTGNGRRARRRKPAAEAAAELKGPKIEEVRKKILDVIEEFGNEGAAEVLEPFGVKKISELDAEQYGAVIEGATKYLADDDGGSGGAAD